MIGLRALSCAMFVLCVAGCSSGRYYSHPDLMVPVAASGATIPASLTAGTCTTPVAQPVSDDNKNTVFVHPGMIWLSASQDQKGLAVDGGKWIVQHGYAEQAMDVYGRDPELMAPVMAGDPGTRFIALHYSMGGSTDLLMRSLAATEKASKMSGRQLVYFPILIDPASFTSVGDSLDMDSPYLGQMFLFISEEGSAWRTSVTSISHRVLDHPKMHLLYAEDFGLKWSHFGVLESLTAEQSLPTQQRVKKVFEVIVQGINAGTDAKQIEAQLNALKIDYARADKRPVLAAWLQHTNVACGTQNVATQACANSTGQGATPQSECGVETAGPGRSQNLTVGVQPVTSTLGQ